MGRRLVLGLLIGCLSTIISCTRGVEDLEVSLELPVISESASASSQLETLIVNLHNVPNKPNPWFFEFDFEKKAFDGTISIPEVPKARGIMIQVLGVFEDQDSGGVTLKYGGKTVDLSQSSDVTIQVKSQNHSARMGELSGRYLNASAPHPTGRLVGYYQPASDHPKMKVWESEIVSGWFRGIALEDSGVAGTNAGMHLVVENEKGEHKQTLFENLRFKDVSGTTKLYYGTATTPNEVDMFVTSRMLIYKPKSYRMRGNGEMELEGATLSAIGFFGPGVNTSTHKICYPEVREALMRVKKDSATPGVLEPLDVHLTASASSGELIRRLDGGVQDPLSAHYRYGGVCSPTDANHLRITHTHLGDRAEDAIGIRPPFKSMGFSGEYPEFIHGDYSITESGKITLKWTMLAGAQNEVSGYELYYRSFSDSSNEDNDEGEDAQSDVDSCSELSSKGFKKFYSSMDPSTHEHRFTSLDGVSLSDSNWNQYEYAVCAFKEVEGKRRYIGNYVRSSCLGNSCQDILHTGWSPDIPVENVIISVDQTFDGLGGRFARVTEIGPEAAPADHLLKIKISIPGYEFQPGDEALFVIQSEGTPSSCGNFLGQDLNVGMIHSARVISSGTSPENHFTVPRGGWLEGVNNSFVDAAPIGAMDHCLIQAIKVPHYRSLSILTGINIDADPFNFVSTESGGMIALRVNGKLTMAANSAIRASGKGFVGGSSSTPIGASHKGAASAVDVPGAAGGFSSSSAAGGGGAGAGGNGGSNSLGGGVYASGGISVGGYFGQLSLLLGGGGGNGFYGSNYSGGNGGGWIFVSAQEFSSPTTGTAPSIEANGESRPVGTPDIGGGGGGGSVNVFFKKSSGKVSLNAKGGDGGDNSTVWESIPGGAGNGGGGNIFALICNLGETGATTMADVAWSAIAGENDWKVDYGDGSGDGPTKKIWHKDSGGYSWSCQY